MKRIWLDWFESMKEIHPKVKVAILRILRDSAHPIGSSAIALRLRADGFDLSSRTIRLYLQQLEQNGLVGAAARGRDGGRTITPRGVAEIRDAQVIDRVGYTSVKIDAYACQTTLNLSLRTGLIVLNVSTVDTEDLKTVIELILPVFKAGLGMGDYLAIARENQRLGQFQIPKGKIGIGTVCSVTLNGVLLNHGIPVISRFGGVLELTHKECSRFTDVIEYAGSSLDPLEIFIKGKFTSVKQAASSGNGRIGASFREVPSTVIGEVQNLHRKMHSMGLGRILLFGAPNQSLLDFPLHEGRTGFIIAGGLNPVAALEESGIGTTNFALCTLYPFEKLIHYKDLIEKAQRNEI